MSGNSDLTLNAESHRSAPRQTGWDLRGIATLSHAAPRPDWPASFYTSLIHPLLPVSAASRDVSSSENP